MKAQEGSRVPAEFSLALLRYSFKVFKVSQFVKSRLRWMDVRTLGFPVRYFSL
jgi:hypothetical protein